MMAVTDRELSARRADLDAPSANDSTSSEVTARLLVRLLESFFRHPLLCLLPLLLFGALGVLAVAGAERSFESSGVMNVSNQTLLADLTNMRGGEGFGWETPAAVTARRINELLGTDEFAATVATDAGLGPTLDSGELTLDDVRASIVAAPAGGNLVRVSASSDVPDRALGLTEATLDAFVHWMIEGDVGQSTAAEEFFTGLVERYEQEVVEARSALEEFMAANPSSATLRPATERAEIDRLTTGLELAQDRYGAAIAGVQEAQLATEQTMSDVSQRLRLVDAPQLPLAPESARKDLAVTAALYLALGLLFSSALVGVGAVADRSIHTASDARIALGRPVVAVVPDGQARGRRA